MGDNDITMIEGRVQKYVDRYWDAIMKLNRAIGQMHFTTLAQLTVNVLNLPHSKVNCVRAFSVV